MAIGLAIWRRLLSVRAQAALLILLVAGSLAVLGFDFVSMRVSVEREREVREQLRSASKAMAELARTVDIPDRLTNGLFDRTNSRLVAITNQVLANYPEIEGGFYLGGEADRFAGYAFPSRPHRPHEPHKTDPPPLEAPYIRLQARESLASAPGETRLSMRDVEASRVLILTEPVGDSRPARAATWLMFRLIDPRQLGNQVRRYQTTTAMAIAGLALAAGLLLNLGRSLNQQRVNESRLRDELRRSEHLAALGKLLAGVAHEVRNPLAAIRSTVQLWQRLPDEARTRDSLDAVVGAVDRLNQTVTQLLYFSRQDHSERTEVRLPDLLRETVGLFAAEAASQAIKIETRFDESAPPITGSPNGLQQLFSNLVRNALQAMPHGGDLQLVLTFDRSSGRVVVEVRDTGHGVASQDRSRLFEPFFTTRSDGTGLGLALCREIVVQHGGTIDYLDGANRGATFRVTFPRS